jgi:broad specificity phosphatase PhoE
MTPPSPVPPDVPAPTVALVRHAATAWSGHRYGGRSDPPLDADGLVAARDLAAGLVGTIGPESRIVSSPLQRARVTAEAIAAATGATIDLDERWQEADFGAVEGLTFHDLVARWPDLAQRLADGETDIDWPDGETAAAFDARIRSAWMAIADDPRPTIVVAHAGPLRVVLAIAAGRRPSEMWLPQPASIVWVPAPGMQVAPTVARPPDGPRATLGR